MKGAIINRWRANVEGYRDESKDLAMWVARKLLESAVKVRSWESGGGRVKDGVQRDHIQESGGSRASTGC